MSEPLSREQVEAVAESPPEQSPIWGDADDPAAFNMVDLARTALSAMDALAAAQAQVSALRDSVDRALEYFEERESVDYSDKSERAAGNEEHFEAEALRRALTATQSAAEAHDERIREDERRQCAKVAREVAALGVPFTTEGDSFSAGARRVASAIEGRK